MAINKVNNETEEKNFKFLQSQSTIIRTVDIDKITFNGVNVIVEKPKVGDVMCVTKYKDSSNTLLGADKQKVVWIDGLSIVPKQLSTEFEPVGICLVVNGNKAIVKYKTDDYSNNRIFSTTNSVTFDRTDIEPNYYFNNGFYNNQQSPTRHAGCCKARFYEKTQEDSGAITSKMTNIFKVPGRDYMPVKEVEFNDTGNDYCEILRDNFDTYDDYLDSMMIKVPCGKGAIGKFTSGKYITYKLASTSYPLLNWAANISVNAPKLGIGNWFIPSIGEMAQIMRNITYGTSFWDNNNIDNNTDIVNRVLYKLTNYDSGNWHMLSSSSSKWTSSICTTNGAFMYDANKGTFGQNTVNSRYKAMAITIYEF